MGWINCRIGPVQPNGRLILWAKNLVYASVEGSSLFLLLKHSAYYMLLAASTDTTTLIFRWFGYEYGNILPLCAIWQLGSFLFCCYLSQQQQLILYWFYTSYSGHLASPYVVSGNLSSVDIGAVL